MIEIVVVALIVALAAGALGSRLLRSARAVRPTPPGHVPTCGPGCGCSCDRGGGERRGCDEG